MEWLETASAVVAESAGCDPGDLKLSEGEKDALLDASRVAAHTSGERINAPLICTVIGMAAAKTGASIESLARLVESQGGDD